MTAIVFLSFAISTIERPFFFLLVFSCVSQGNARMKALLAFCAAALLLVGTGAVDITLTDEVVEGYVDAFEKYQIAFDKHYATPEEYRLRLRAYAVCLNPLSPQHPHTRM